jgi:elongator complex protein 3
MLTENIIIDKENIEVDVHRYSASGGEEMFISLVDNKHDAVVGYLRLREMGSPHRWELQQNQGLIIRELKIVGRELPIGEKTETGWQHKGFGQQLINEAEQICAEEFDKNHLFVLSGVGVKEYYRKLDFKDKGVYLCKKVTG